MGTTSCTCTSDIYCKWHNQIWTLIICLHVESNLNGWTCQCWVTAFHTPTFPVWLVATSWLPMKNRESTGTPRLNTPSQKQRNIISQNRHTWMTTHLHILFLFCPSTYFTSAPSILDAPQYNAALWWRCHHLVFISMGAAYNFCIEGHPLYGPVQVRAGKHLLPARRFLYPKEQSQSANGEYDVYYFQF